MDVGANVNLDGRPGRGMDELVALARLAEDVGLNSLWLPEHVVFVQGSKSRYPYNPTGELALGRRPGVFDPLIGLAVAAAVTERVRLGTSVLILPERQPVVLAQQVVALDHASAGRIDLGIGVGWLQEEFEALEVPWERRGDRADDYLRAMRVLWEDEVASYAGEFVRFADVQAWPKPVQQPGPPVWVGGDSPAALRRTAALAEGWYGWALDLETVTDRLGRLAAACEAAGRDPASVRVKIGLGWTGEFDGLRPYRDGLAELSVGGFTVEELVVAPAARGIPMTERLAALAELVARP